jgi:hypothetical protein
VWGKVLLQVKVRHNNIRGRGEEIAKLVVKNDLATVLGVLETLVNDVLVNELGNLRARDEIGFWKCQELTQLRCNFLLSVETVVRGTSLSLLTGRIILDTLHFTNELNERLDISTESGNFSLNGFKRHYILSKWLIFKSEKQ